MKDNTSVNLIKDGRVISVNKGNVGWLEKQGWKLHEPQAPPKIEADQTDEKPAKKRGRKKVADK